MAMVHSQHRIRRRAPRMSHSHHANDNTKLTTMNIALNIPLGEFPMCDTIDKRFANMV